MKVVGFMGSVRKGGNTEVMLRSILDGAREKGAETEMFSLHEHNYSECTACYHCMMHDGECALNDDMQIFYKAIRECDAFVLASPVYMGQMSGISKIFFDRLLAFLKPDYSPRQKPGIKVLTAYVQTVQGESTFAAYFKSTTDMFGFLGYKPQDPLVIGGVKDKGELEKNVPLLSRAKEAGRALVK
ncbi:MAG: flavodoxin family protein [Vulcanimicrobiota bacterium]